MCMNYLFQFCIVAVHTVPDTLTQKVSGIVLPSLRTQTYFRSSLPYVRRLSVTLLAVVFSGRTLRYKVSCIASGGLEKPLLVICDGG